jgi:hypothetical protein
MAELAREMNVKLHVHLLEAERNRQEEPLRALDLAGVLGPMLIGAHAVHVTEPCVSRSDYNARPGLYSNVTASLHDFYGSFMTFLPPSAILPSVKAGAA